MIGDEGLEVLTKDNPPRRWAANAPQQNQREDRFLKSLEVIKEWGWVELSEAFDPSSDDNFENIEEWIAKKDDTWLRRFYAVLEEARKRYELFRDDALDGDLKSYYSHYSYYSYHIVRVQAKSGEDKHVRPSEAWFPSEPGDEKNFPNIDFVKPEVYRKGKKGQQEDEESRAFLKYIGVRLLDERGLIEKQLERYNDSTKTDKQHISELKQFIRFWKKNGDTNIFKDYRFLRGVKDGESSWCNPQELCLDAPYEITGLAEVTNIHDRPLVWKEYEKTLPKDLMQDFTNFLRALGVMKSLEVEEVYIRGNPHWKDKLCRFPGNRSGYEFTEDYSIIHIEEYLREQSVTASRLVWNALIRADSKSEKAYYYPNKTSYTNRHSKPNESASKLIHHCKEYPWIPTKSGEFRKPAEMTRDELRDDFLYNDWNGLLTAINFGEQDRKHGEEHRARDEKAKDAGFESADEHKKFLRLRDIMKKQEMPIDEFLEKMERSEPTSSADQPQKPRKPQFPVKPIADRERREEGVRQQLTNAPVKQYDKQERIVRKGSIDPDPYLRGQYTNEDHQMVCQACRKKMPFKKRNDEYYFEAIEILSRHYLPNEMGSQYLALCPLCAAKYREFITHTKTFTGEMDTLKKAIIDAKNNQEGVSIPVSFGKENAHISFTETHHCDLKIILTEPSGNSEGQAGQ